MDPAEVEDEGSRRFDLSTGPLIRGRLLRLSEQEHVLLVTMHHIVSDGWSMGVLIQEVATLYAAYREGQENPLPPLPIQYADYAVWQRQWLQGEVLQGQLDYWKSHLLGAPALLELPTDRPRPRVQSYRGASVGFALSATLSNQLKQLSRSQDATLFMTLYTGLSILLSRLSGQSDVVIGTPIANRQRVEIEGLIGFFVNTLALRVNVDDNPSVKALLGRVKALTLSGYSHQDVPFEQIVEAVQPPRSLSHGPIFQAMLVLQNTPQEALSLPGLTLAPQGSSHRIEKFDLTVTVHEAGDRIVGSFSYASDLFDQSTITRWVGYFQTLLGEMGDEVEQRVQTLKWLPEHERTQLINTFNATEVDYPRDQLIHQLFEAQAQKTPDAIAVIYEEHSLTYQQLNEKANQLAHYLRTHGVGPDQLVAMCVERSVEMIVGLLGILKAGGAYVPLDPSYPSERLSYMLSDAAPRVVLTQERLKDSLPISAAAIIALDSEWEDIARHSDSNLGASALKLSSRHLAYVIYTSG